MNKRPNTFEATVYVRRKAHTRNYEEKFSYSSYAFLVNCNYTMSCCVIVSTCHSFDREYVSFRRKRQPVPRFIFFLRAIHFCFLFRSSLSFPRWFLLVSMLEPPRYKRMHFAARNHLEAITTESNSLARPVHLFNRCTKHFSETVTLKRRKHFSLHGIIVYQVIGPWRIQRWPKGFSARKSNVREIIGSIPFFFSFFFSLRFFTAGINIGSDRLHRTVPPFCIVQQKDASVTTWKIIAKKVYVIRLHFARRQLRANGMNKN